MPFLADRVQDLTTTTGVGAVTLSNTPPNGFRSFASALGSGNKEVDYSIEDILGNWEVGTGVFNGTTTLTRVTVSASSNANSYVNFPAGSKTVSLIASAKLLDGLNKSIETNFLFMGA